MLPSKIFFDDFLDDFDTKKGFNSLMKCDIYEKNNNYHIEMDIPGFKKDDVKISFEDGYITVACEKHEETKEEDKDKKYIRRERSFHESCERKFYVGNIDEDRVNAEFRNGTLSIVVPKEEKEKESKKYININ
ncbi:MAG: Hsp20/alpha crystallin family protein [Bacilli bacterium]|nr:Hsp20/alpha crystallin family protein [Bacilli bacterium]